MMPLEPMHREGEESVDAKSEYGSCRIHRLRFTAKGVPSIMSVAGVFVYTTPAFLFV